VRDARHDHAERFELSDGKILDATLSALPDGGTLLTFVDVTDSVNLERSLTDSAAEMAKLARLREDFVHRVSYELRAPLTNIIGFAQLIGEGAAGPLSERQREYTDHILRSSGTLLEHVNDILDLAAMDNGDFVLNRTDVDLAAVIRSAGDSLADRMNEKKIRFVASVEPAADAIIADEQRLRQVLRNLLSNAVSFSEAGSDVAVEARRDGANIAISVIDHGCGIPAAVQQRIFGRFESDSLGSSHRGVGLGLAIAKSLVEQHGGAIALVSTPGKGTTVTCTLPRQGGLLADAAE
jgi:signal transduction histidine kinase